MIKENAQKRIICTIMAFVMVLEINMPISVCAASAGDVKIDYIDNSDIGEVSAGDVCEDYLNEPFEDEMDINFSEAPEYAEIQSNDISINRNFVAESNEEYRLVDDNVGEGTISLRYKETDYTLKISGVGTIKLNENYKNAIQLQAESRLVENIIFEDCKLQGSATRLFFQINSLKSIDFTGLDTSEVTTMQGMFYGCTGLRGLNLSKFDTGRVTDMAQMFYGCSGLESIDLSNFDTRNVTKLGEEFFKGCEKLSVIKTPKALGTESIKLPRVFCDEQGKGNYTEISESNNAHSQTLLEKTYANSYIVRFDANGGDGAMQEQRIAIGESQALTANSFVRKGYAFAGWNTKADGSGKNYSDGKSVKNLTTKGKKITLYAKWTVSKYTIHFDGNGATSGTMAEMTQCKYGKEYSLAPNTYQKAGFSFAYWNTERDGSGKSYTNRTVVESLSERNNDIVILYAQWYEGGYSVTYVLNGGVNDENNLNNYTGVAAVILQNPVRKGYKFDGWYSDPKMNSRVLQIPKENVDEITLYAKWTVNKYTIHFEGNDSTGNNSTSVTGNMSDMKNCAYDKKYTLSVCKYRKYGYTFVGWNTAKDGTGQSFKNKESIKNLAREDGSVIFLYAQWKMTDYALNYRLNGGTNAEGNPAQYNMETATITLRNPIRQGYTFDGWYSDSKKKNRVLQIPKGNVGNRTLYAKWTPNKYTIHFEGNGRSGGGNVSVTGTMSDQKNRTYDKKYTLPKNNFRKDGYTFVGWNTSSDGSGISYKNRQSFKNLTDRADSIIYLYAQWKLTEYAIVYKLDGGTNVVNEEEGVVNPNSYNKESAFIFQNPIKKGYIFDGWYSGSKKRNRVTEIMKGTSGKITLYAKWLPINYHVILNGNGADSGEMLPMSNCIYGKAYSLKANGYVRVGYVFKGWNTERDGSGTSYKNKAQIKNLTNVNKETVTLYAQWEKSQAK